MDRIESRAAGTRHVALAIRGMHCAACVGRVERALAGAPGVSHASVNLASNRAAVDGDAAVLHPAELIVAVERAGYGAELLTERRTEPEAGAEQRWETLRVAAAAALSVPLLLPMLGVPLPGWLQLGVAAPVQFLLGGRLYRNAWSALRAGSGNMDLLVALGTTAAFLYSLYLLAAGGHHFYFEAGAVVITLVMIGRRLEDRAKRATTGAMRALLSLRPETARIARDGREIEIPADAVAVGDTILIRPGERLPVDGTIASGRSEFDESLLTGESMPVAREVGDAVPAGAINGSGLLRVTATAVAAQSTVARIIDLVERTQAQKAPVQRLVDRVAAVFVPISLAVAAAALLGWWLVAGDLDTGVVAAISVLVVACPCALGLATPTALVVGTGAAAHAGILIRDVVALERARRIDTVVLDKTGTLTEGKPKVVQILAQGIGERDLLALAAAAQGGSEHPLARAVIAAAEGLALPHLDSFAAAAGAGLRAVVAGRAIAIGNRRLMEEEHVDMAALAAQAEALEGGGRTVAWVAALAPPQLLGLIATADPAKPTAAEAVRRLAAEGFETVMVTGDSPRTAAAVTAELGVARVLSGVLPAEKAAEVRRLQAQGKRIAMVGDGINDAPALAAADIGIAMGTGVDVAIETAGIALMRGDPLLVADAIAISRATYDKIREGLFWAFIYNIIAMPVAAMGLLNPVIAGAAMAASSLSVVLNALRLRRWHGA
jgi:P-type Cu+ transporter